MTTEHQTGTYNATITNQVIEDRGRGAKLSLTLTISETGKTVWANLSLTDKDGNKDGDYYKQTMAVVRYLGFADDRITVLDPNHPEHHSFVGIQCEAYCKVKPDDSGKEWENWYINTPREATEPISQTNLRKLDAMFAKPLKEIGVTEAPKAKPAPQPEPEPQGHPLAEKPSAEDASIPF
jgi:hypothetical protein